MTNDDLTLRDVARAVLSKHDVSGRQLDAYARDRGLTISYTTINAMAAGAYRSRPSRKTLDALVTLSDLPESVVYQAAGVPAPVRSLAQDLPPDADTLTELQRDAVVAVVRQFAEANRAIARLSKENDRGNTAPIAGDIEQPGTRTSARSDEVPSQADYAKAAQSNTPKTRANRARRRAEKNRIPGEDQSEALEGGT